MEGKTSLFIFADDDGMSLGDVAELDTMVSVVDDYNFLKDYSWQDMKQLADPFPKWLEQVKTATEEDVNRVLEVIALDKLRRQSRSKTSLTSPAPRSLRILMRLSY